MLSVVRATIETWYKQLEFPAEYDNEFYAYLDTVEIDPEVTAETYEEDPDGAKNFLTYLYCCEALKRRYEEKGIDLSILYATLQELWLWTRSRTNRAGKLWLADLWWVKKTMTMKLFRLGRLNFCMGEEEHDLPELGLPKGAPIIEVHIPRAPSLKAEDCAASLAQARSFFATYFPDFHYREMTCDSWLLDDRLLEILPPESNILKFQALFDIVLQKPSDETLNYVLGRPTTRETVAEKEATTSLARKVKEYAMNGVEFHEGYGLIKR